MTLIISDWDQGAEGKDRHERGGGGVSVGGGVMEGKESKRESHKMARGDPVGQSGPFVCARVCLRGCGK